MKHNVVIPCNNRLRVSKVPLLAWTRLLVMELTDEMRGATGRMYARNWLVAVNASSVLTYFDILKVMPPLKMGS